MNFSLDDRSIKVGNRGFTIIETVLVLAIAGLIFLVVFIAYPQLRRDVRNRQRYADATMFMAEVQKCVSRTGDWSECNSVEELDFDVSRFQIYTEYEYGSEEHNPITVDGPVWLFNTRCARADWTSPADKPSHFTVNFALEKNVGRCIDGS